ncbi:MAG: flavin reductase family protein [Solirubrobacteraceae bacterium]|nr:flavin reductase family protein [Solirubrobacteraceae bacterium]
MREEISVDAIQPGMAYALLTSTIVPRPIAWVSSRSADGIDNLAPHSFFTVASASPPLVQFTSVGDKDTLANVLATKEFVIHLTPAGLLEAVNDSGTAYPPEIDEFDAAGLGREPSVAVGPMRVAGSPVAIECKLHSTIDYGKSTVVVGEVLHFAIDKAVMADDGLPDVQALAPLARLGRNEWSKLGEVVKIDRKHYDG